MFTKFGDYQKAYEIFQRWVRKEISCAQEWNELFDLVKDLTAEQFDDFLETIEIEYGFKEFERGFQAIFEYEIFTHGSIDC